jgi:hypothetical protein
MYVHITFAYALSLWLHHSPAFCIGGRGFCGVLIFSDIVDTWKFCPSFCFSASVLYLDLVSSFIYYRLSYVYLILVFIVVDNILV